MAVITQLSSQPSPAASLRQVERVTQNWLRAREPRRRGRRREMIASEDMPLSIQLGFSSVSFERRN